MIGFISFFTLSTGEPDFLTNEKNGFEIGVTLYDSQGNPIKSGLTQTTIQGVPGVFYMSISIRASNQGQVPLGNLKITESHPSEFTNALQGAVAFQPSLATGEENVLEYDTANACTVDGQCGTGERCRDTNQDSIADSCLIDISNFIGDITYGATLTAELIGAVGELVTDSTLVNVLLEFSQDEIIFRTNIKQDIGTEAYFGTDEISDTSDGSLRWIAVDKDEDGFLEAYGYTGETLLLSGGDCSTLNQNHLLVIIDYVGIEDIWIYKDTFQVNDIFVCVEDSIPGVINYIYRRDIGGASSAIISSISVEPYKSINCGLVIPCQERYSVAVSPPTPFCGNDIVESGEICDGVDLIGQTCATQGFDLGTLNCLSSCSSYDTSQCTFFFAGGNIKFRTGSLNYGCGDRWISYTDSCGAVLDGYGADSSSSFPDTSCNSIATLNNWIFLSNLPYAPQGDTCGIHRIFLNNDDGDGIISLYKGGEFLYICENGLSDGKSSFTEYSKSSSRVCTDDSCITSFSVDPSRELMC